MQLPPTVLSENDHKPESKSKSAKKVKDQKGQTTKTSNPSQTDDQQAPELPSKTESGSSAKLVLKPPRSLTTTLFARLENLHGKRIKTLLQVQYRSEYVQLQSLRNYSSLGRMNSKIAAFPSKELYESSLVDHTSVKDHLLQDLVNGMGI